MGTWDVGPFDNDEAMDFVGRIEDLGDALTIDDLMPPIRFALAPSHDSPYHSDAPAVAAIALLAGLAPGDGDVEIPKPSSKEIETMVAAIDAIVSPGSDLRQAWDDDEGWLADMAKLRTRAQKPKRRKRPRTSAPPLAGPPLPKELNTGDVIGIPTQNGIRYLQARGPRERHGGIWLRLLPPADGRTVEELAAEPSEFSVVVADVLRGRRAVGAHYEGNHPVPPGESGQPITISRRPTEWLIMEPDGTRHTIKNPTDAERAYSRSEFIVWEEIVIMSDLEWHPRQDPPRGLIALRRESGRLA